MKRTRKTEKGTDKKSGGEKHEEAAATTTGRVHTIAKARPTAVTRAPKEKPVAVIPSSEGPAETTKATAETPKTPKRQATEATPRQPDDSQDTVVFAIRLTRAEREELHSATGSGKASRFVKAIVLAGARGDMKAIQEIVDEVQASRR